MYKLYILLLLTSLNVISQTKFTSAKSDYSFVIPEGWYKKEKIYSPDVEAKIIDGKGNSFIVTVNVKSSTRI